MLRALFGPGKEEIWRAVASTVGGTYVEGGLLGADAVRAEVRDWTLTLDTYTSSSGEHSTTYTRMRAPFVNREGLRFRITTASIFSKVAKLFGVQDIEIGHDTFDRHFVVQGNDEERVRALFSNPRVRALLFAQPKVRLEVKDDEGLLGKSYGEHVDVLSFEVPEVVKDVARLRGLFLLFAEVLDEVCHGAAAYQDLPGRGSDDLRARPPGLAAAEHADLVRAVVDPWGGVVAREGDVTVARVPAPTSAVDGEAELRVAIPALPAWTGDVSLRAPLPPSLARVEIRPRRLWSGLSVEKTGDAAVDEHLAVRAEGDARRRLPALLPALSDLAPLGPQVALEQGVLQARVPGVPADLQARAAAGLLDLWSRAARERLGLT